MSSISIRQIEWFIDTYELTEAVDILNELLDTSLSSEDADHWDKEKRNKVISLVRKTQGLLPAIYQITPLLTALKSVQ